jgi:hypothetical protein
MRFNRSVVLSTVALVAASIVLVAAACGGGGPATYTNKDFKFQLTYDSSVLTESTSVSAAGSSGGKSALEVGFVNPKGTKSGGEYRDGLVVSVYKLTQKVTDSTLPLVKTELEGILPQLQQSLGSDTTLSALTQIEINGIKGFTSDASYTMDGAPFKAKIYFLINGDLEYQVTAQAADSKWSTMEPVFKALMDSFKTTQ